jgi:ubiquinone/menaquinone biosynthesis C-methylase UbiE
MHHFLRPLMVIKDAAFTGAIRVNPYDGLLDKGIDYDWYEVEVVHSVDSDPRKLLNNYRYVASLLLRHADIAPGSHVLELGCGTGISTLEILTKNPSAMVTGLDVSTGMLAVAMYKHHMDDGSRLLEMGLDQELLGYWDVFRKESEQFKGHVKLIWCDFPKTSQFKDESIDTAVANQFMHWTDLSMSFRELNRILKDNASITWNTASHFFDDHEFRAADYAFRYNDILKYICDDVAKEVAIAEPGTLNRPKHDLDSITEISKFEGMQTVRKGCYLVPVYLPTFIRHHVPKIVKQLIRTQYIQDLESAGYETSANPEGQGLTDDDITIAALTPKKVNLVNNPCYAPNNENVWRDASSSKIFRALIAKPEEFVRITNAALATAITNPHALADRYHKWDVVPVFESRKI